MNLYARDQLSEGLRHFETPSNFITTSKLTHFDYLYSHHGWLSTHLLSLSSVFSNLVHEEFLYRIKFLKCHRCYTNVPPQIDWDCRLDGRGEPGEPLKNHGDSVTANKHQNVNMLYCVYKCRTPLNIMQWKSNSLYCYRTYSTPEPSRCRQSPDPSSIPPSPARCKFHYLNPKALRPRSG